MDLEVGPGEVHALLGDNGAGKSTLMRILAGVTTPDQGTVEIAGRPVHFSGPAGARAAGIETVYQDLALASSLSAGENIFLGREILRRGLLGRLGFVDRRAMARESTALLAELGASMPSGLAAVESFSGGQRQAVAVARAVRWGSVLVMLDEPTAALGVQQTSAVLDLICRVRDERNVSVLLVSHNLPDVYAVADRVTVLRLGTTVLTGRISDLSVDDLIGAMTGASSIRGAAS